MKRCPSSLIEHFRWVQRAVVVVQDEPSLFHTQALGWSFHPNRSLQQDNEESYRKYGS